MKLILLIFSIFIGITNLEAQVNIKEDPDVTKIMTSFDKSNKSPDKTISGWRVQISASVDRRQIEITKKQFQRDFPQYPVVSSYDNPYYKLKAGAFTQKNSAESALSIIKSKYKSAYLTRDIVKTMELNKDQD
jgi:hypothetical protein